jgi:hypothetical protein
MMQSETADNYESFLQQKIVAIPSVGQEITDSDVHPMLFPFQRDIVKWAVRKGRAAVFVDTGLGKTFIQLEWARLIGENTLFVAPLSVARQTTREAVKLGLGVRYVRGQGQVTGEHKLWITNYEMIANFDLTQFGAIVLDESSILKAIDGKTRAKLVRLCADIPYRLCCSATPAPNDYTELGNHAHFLGVCTTAEMLSMFFINANKQQTFVIEGKVYEKKGSNKGGQEWRLKHHAEEPFFSWLASWAITMMKPSDLGYDDDGFILPPLTITPQFVHSEYQTDGQLFFTGLKGIGDRSKARRSTIDTRLEALTTLVNGSDEQWIIWVGLDDESRLVTEAIEGAVEVKGSHSPEYKAEQFERFQDGQFKVLVTKGKIGGFGMNFQCAHHMAFFGLNDSWETFYQCVRREWRYRQPSAVDVHIILSDAEAGIYQNVMRKDAMAKRLREKLIEAVQNYERNELGMTTSIHVEYNPNVDFILPAWIGGQDDLRVRLCGMRQTCEGKAQPIEHQDTTEVLQPEMSRNGKEGNREGADGQRHLSLPELRQVGGDIQKPVGSEELRSEVLQPEVSRGIAKGNGQSRMGRRATYPEWIRSCLSA